MSNAKNSTRLGATARFVPKRTEPLLRQGAAPTELSGYLRLRPAPQDVFWTMR